MEAVVMIVVVFGMLLVYGILCYKAKARWETQVFIEDETTTIVWKRTN